MNTFEILRDARDQLLKAMIVHSNEYEFRPLNTTPWIAMSVLQKAVRRGELRLALSAAATLLDRSPDRAWRRVGCIAYEDVGHGSIDVVSFATAALQGKRFRSNVGSEWKVLSFIVAHLVAAPKCRAADDIVNVR